MTAPVSPTPTTASQPPLLRDQFRAAARAAGQPETWIESLTSWVTAFIVFHGKRHPRDLDAAARDAFLRHVVQTRKDPLGALAAARLALRLLYEDVLQQPVGELPQPRPPRLLDQLRQVLRLGHYAPQTEKCYVQWATRFILFHDKRHPRTMRTAEVEHFLTHLATDAHVAASTQNQALDALVFLYSRVLDIDLGRIDALRARRGKRLPVVLAPEEVGRVLACVQGADGAFRLMAQLLYGAGLRLMECCRLRVPDINLERQTIHVRAGKGDKDRTVMLPKSIRAALEGLLARRKRMHQRDQQRGADAVWSAADAVWSAADYVWPAVDFPSDNRAAPGAGRQVYSPSPSWVLSRKCSGGFVRQRWLLTCTPVLYRFRTAQIQHGAKRENGEMVQEPEPNRGRARSASAWRSASVVSGWRKCSPSVSTRRSNCRKRRSISC